MRRIFLLFIFSTVILHAKSAVRNQTSLTITNTLSINYNDAPKSNLEVLANAPAKLLLECM